ncbi:MAG TPA: 3-oxoacid CoA-transferase [Acidimicrobiales bacterium]|nr:3-oxoacid CoA-transferase [Acidimicrobiales bacterium]
MNKIASSPTQAVADVVDGSSVAIAGFGLAHRFPSSLIIALGELGSKRLTVYCNGLGQPGHATAHLLAENHQLGKLVASFSARPGVRESEAETQIAAGQLDFEVVPQGTLVERMRAGGAGLAALYTPTAFGTPIAEGKEIRYFDGKPYVLEMAITTDFAFIRGYRGDRLGNIQLRGGSRNFNVSFAKAARIAIAEVEEIVEPGEIPPDLVDIPGAFVARVVQSTYTMDTKTLPMRPSRAAQSARSYDNKLALTRSEIAQRAALLLEEHTYVNLGAGIPNLISNYLEGRDVVLHAENGILDYGSFADEEDFDPDVHDAGGWFVTTKPGTSFFESVTSFEIARSGRLSTVVLGAYQVAENGDFANWATPEMAGGGVGGAMDLAVGAKSVMITMEHCDSSGRPKLVDRCTYPLTAIGVVDTVVTDLALLRRVDGAFHLLEVARGFTVEEVVALTGMHVEVAPEVGIMQDAFDS